ncbi:MAG: cob(I)yrinic acid a,c-diamide adenosyltransferase [Clostridiaceae bacterium]|nr:cob(I)yrinic acid a,c-diamide adenosyltransferase [Clostridiaceae bacterium]
MRGLVHVYTGDGKGKTTAAIGLGIRACGRGLKVFMVQFLKSMETGELASLKKLEPGFTLCRGTSPKKFTWEMDAREMEEARDIQSQVFDTAVDAVFSGKWDVVILDEVMAAVNEGLLEKEKVIDLARNKPDNLELVYTGRNAPAELIELADYVSEIVQVKHPMDKGIKARKGIEF